jgi:uncharacterized protein (TIGR02646 family)
MIKILRSGKPRNEFKYNEDFIVKRLWDMQHEQCCYCENKIPLKGHLKAVEHFKQKSVFKELTNDWDNLLLACAQCNGKKSDKFPLELFKINDPEGNPEGTVIYLKEAKDLKKGAPLLIDPSKEDPEKHLDFVCDIANSDLGLIKTKGGSKKGDFTIKTIGLYDIFYTKIHRNYIGERLLPFLTMLTEAIDNNDIDTINFRKSEFTQITKANYKLAGLARSFVYNNRLDVNFGIRISD